MAFKRTCWVVYFYRDRYCWVPAATYGEALVFLASLVDKPAVEPLGIYRLKRRRFEWQLRASFNATGIQRQHEGALLGEIKRLKGLHELG